MNDFVSFVWLQHKKEFRLRAMVDSSIPWNQFLKQLWLQVMAGTKLKSGEQSDRGPSTLAIQALQTPLFSSGLSSNYFVGSIPPRKVCPQKSCGYHQEFYGVLQCKAKG